MSNRVIRVVPFDEVLPDQECDTFALLAELRESLTRDEKPYIRATFRGAKRRVTVPIWSDSSWHSPCRNEWRAGAFYKLRCVLRESTPFGLQLDIRKIRETNDSDRADGFDSNMCLESAPQDVVKSFEQLCELIEIQVHDVALKSLALTLLNERRDILLELPAATFHHEYRGGLLEHTLAVTRIAVALANFYSEQPHWPGHESGRDLTIVGACLHDIGKTIELSLGAAGATHTAEGHLIGHVVLGCDLVRRAAERAGLDRETGLRLEHIVLSHQGTAEGISSKAPLTPEAILVRYANEIDAQFSMATASIRSEGDSEMMTTRRGPHSPRYFRGLVEP